MKNQKKAADSSTFQLTSALLACALWQCQYFGAESSQSGPLGLHSESGNAGPCLHNPQSPSFVQVSKEVFGLKSQLSVAINGKESEMLATFKPQTVDCVPVSVTQYAKTQQCQDMRWVNIVEVDPSSLWDAQQNLIPVPFVDPPKGGFLFQVADHLPFYLDLSSCTGCEEGFKETNPYKRAKFFRVFSDAPYNGDLKPDARDEFVQFLTSLVCVKSLDRKKQQSIWTRHYSFRWRLYNVADEKAFRPKLELTQMGVGDAGINQEVRDLMARSGMQAE